ncbi:U6 snRNA (guanine-N(2))-methyltransferase THUMPD2 [Pelodytes ibericus]
MKPSCPIKRARFFYTAGKGMERFVCDEAIRKAAAADVESLSGKVFFTADLDLCCLKQIKSGERLFLLLHKGPPLSLPKYKGKALSILKKVVIGDHELWRDTLHLWQDLQETQDYTERDHVKVAKRKLEISVLPGSKLCKQERDDLVHVFQDQTHEQSGTRPEDQNFVNVEETIATKPTLPIKSMITFRVSCRCSGANAKVFTAEEVGRIIGMSLVKLFGWKPDLRKPMLEVFVHLNDLYSVVGFPVMRQPLASRKYILSTGLRPTTAWAMATLAELSAGAVVLDPMCGVGTILLEAAKEWPDVQFIGIDISTSQLKGAVANVEAAGVTSRIEFLHGSVLALPIMTECIDVVICDVPFGKKFTSSKTMKELLPEILREMERVVRVGGFIVLLLSQSLHHHLKAYFQFKAAERGSPAKDQNALLHKDKREIAANKDDIVMKTDCFESLVPIESHSVSLGMTEAVIFKCKKSSNPMAS